jgi:hypothetical protein
VCAFDCGQAPRGVAGKTTGGGDMSGQDWVGILFVIGWAVALILLCLFPGPETDNDEHSVGWHRGHGRFRVQYPDGKISQPFTRKVAEDYAEIFGGKVIPK